MHEVLVTAGALIAGALCAGSVWIVLREFERPAISLPTLGPRTDPRLDQAHTWLAVRISRAGWHESPERVAALVAVIAAVLGGFGLSTRAIVEPSTAIVMAIAGAAAGVGGAGWVLRSAIANRRRRLARELAPLLELFILELGGGGSALSALGSVTMQLDSELAAELRRMLIASQVSGSASFEVRLREYAEMLQIPALDSLATVLTASREYGTGVTQGVRALAVDLRHAQRRELIAHSRRALNHVLFPAAIGVLLPFLAILLFPAVTALERNLR
jgi:pilus assembly protein TadC